MSTLVNPPCNHCHGTGRIRKQPMPFVWKIIGQYVPTVWTPEAVKEEFTAWAAERGVTWLPGDIEVRDPIVSKELIEADPRLKRRIESWHYDRTSGGPVTENILMWCNKYPTEVEERYIATLVPNKEYDVLVFDNMRSIHRQRGLLQDDRWFIKIRDVMLDERYFAGV